MIVATSSFAPPPRIVLAPPPPERVAPAVPSQPGRMWWDESTGSLHIGPDVITRETMHSLGTDALTRLVLQLCRQWQVRAPALTPLLTSWAPRLDEYCPGGCNRVNCATCNPAYAATLPKARKIRLSPEEYDRYRGIAQRTAIERRDPAVYDAFLGQYERDEEPRFYNPSASRAPGLPPRLTTRDVWAAQRAALEHDLLLAPALTVNESVNAPKGAFLRFYLLAGPPVRVDRPACPS